MRPKESSKRKLMSANPATWPSVLILCIASSAQGLNRSQVPMSTTVCAIVSAPQKFDRKLVIFSANFVSDGIEHSVLIDKDCEKWGIVPGGDFKEKGEDSLDRVLMTGGPGTSDKKITATFIGIFRWHPKQMIKRILILREIQSVVCEKGDGSECSNTPPSPPKVTLPDC